MTRYQQLTIELLEGRITRTEEQELSDFLREDVSNEGNMLEWKRAWEEEGSSNEQVEVLWQQFLRRVESHKTYIPIYRRRAFRWVAAFLLLLCSVSLTVLFRQRLTQATTLGESSLVMTSTANQANGATTVMMLPDSSRVTLNAGSELAYSSDFGKGERRVLLEGEAYFEVTKHTDCPFIVKADGCEVLVTGTRFNVSAYAENEQTTITLLEGGVQVRHPLFKADLLPGEKLIYTRSSKELTKRQCDAEASIAWMDGKMDFDEIRLEELLSRLSRLYNEPIVMKDTALRNKDVHYFMDERYPLEEVLDALAEVYNLSVAKVNGEWKVDTEVSSIK